MESDGERSAFTYTFMDDDFNKLYQSEKQTGQLFISFAVSPFLSLVSASSAGDYARNNA